MTHREIMQSLLNGEAIRIGGDVAWDEYKLMNDALHTRCWHTLEWEPVSPGGDFDLFSATARVHRFVESDHE